jgi:hypothetical protein
LAARQFLLILGFVLLLRLPFLTQPVQGDDPYYLFGAQHALIDPAHPSHTKYIFQGEMVDMRGHPHPPLDSWILAGLLAIFGDVYEVPFHAAYILFSLIAATGMWSLAKRFSGYPLGATLLFLSVPAFVINGNSFEADLPFLAFWMAGIAFFVAGRYSLAAVALALAAITAYQAVVATPILFVYCWLHVRRSRAAWAVALTPVITVAAYQAYERATSGALPAAVLAGYLSSYGLQQLAIKLKNAAALTAHTGWLVLPALAAFAFRSRWPVALAAGALGFFIDSNPLFFVSFGIGALVIASCVTRKPDFLSAWVVIFFVSALVIFFAGSARYLLPMAAPVAILASRERRWVIPAFAANLVIGLALAWVNYQHWDAYRDLASDIQKEVSQRRVWTNGEWGLRYYLEAEGALPLARTQAFQPGEWIVSSALAYPLSVTAPTARVLEREVTATLPLRLIGLNSRSGYSTAALGFRPFDISTAPIDRVRIDAVLERNPTLSYLPMSAPEAQTQIVSGIFDLEGQWRWTSGRAMLLLKPPPAPEPLQLKIYIPEPAPARKITVIVDNKIVHEQTLPGPGAYTIETKPISGSAVSLMVDKTFSGPGDSRALGLILSEAGFRRDLP